MNKFLIFILVSVNFSIVKCASNLDVTHGVEGPSFGQFDVTLPNVLDIMTRGTTGTRKKNWGGGNLGAYYNFMYPDNDDYPWACTCNMADYKLWEEDKQGYVRCNNQEDLSVQNIQANCDPTNITVKQEF